MTQLHFYHRIHQCNYCVQVITLLVMVSAEKRRRLQGVELLYSSTSKNSISRPVHVGDMITKEPEAKTPKGPHLTSTQHCPACHAGHTPLPGRACFYLVHIPLIANFLCLEGQCYAHSTHARPEIIFVLFSYLRSITLNICEYRCACPHFSLFKLCWWTSLTTNKQEFITGFCFDLSTWTY